MGTVSQVASSQRTWAGIDVSKHHWDVAVEDAKQVEHCQADSSGRAVKLLREHGVTHVCVESTGGWERQLVRELREAGLLVSIVNPARVRDFAKAHGQLAKTDKLDALMIVRFAAMMQPEPSEKPRENQEKLRSLRARRQQVNDALVQEKNRLATQPDHDARRSIRDAIDFYDKQLKSLDEQIQRLMQTDAEFCKLQTLLVSVPGIGATTAAALAAEMPELGQRNRRELAKLAGLAPVNRDSGMMRGRRMIGGGRANVRKALYMATLVATKHNPIIKAHYQQLLERGKAKMTALVACMRKLLSILNVLVKNQTPWNPKPTT